MTRLNYAAQQHKLSRNGPNASSGPTVALPLNFNGPGEVLGSARESAFPFNAAQQCQRSSQRTLFMTSVNPNKIETGSLESPQYYCNSWQMMGKRSSEGNIVERLAAANACRALFRGESYNPMSVNHSTSGFQISPGMVHPPWMSFQQPNNTFHRSDSYSGWPSASATTDFSVDGYPSGSFTATRDRPFPGQWKSARTQIHSRSPKQRGGMGSLRSPLWGLTQNVKAVPATGFSASKDGFFKVEEKVQRQPTIINEGEDNGPETTTPRGYPGGGIQWLFDAAAAATAASRSNGPTSLHSFGQHARPPAGGPPQRWNIRQHPSSDLSPSGLTTNVSVAGETVEDIPSPRTAPARGPSRAVRDAMSPLSLPTASSMRMGSSVFGDRRGEGSMFPGMFGHHAIGASGKQGAAPGYSNSEWDFCRPADTIEEDCLFRHDELHRRRHPRYLARTRRLHDLHIVIPISVPSGRVRVDDIFGANFYEFTDKKAGVHVLFGRGVASDTSGTTTMSNSPKKRTASRSCASTLEDLKPACDVWASFLNIRLGTIYNLHLDQIPLVVDLFRNSFDDDLCHFYVPISMDCHGVYPSSDELISQRALRPVLLLRESRDGKRFATERYETRAVPTTENDVKRLRMIRRHVQIFATRFVEMFGSPATPPTVGDPGSPYSERGSSASFMANSPSFGSTPYFPNAGGPLGHMGSFRLLPPDPVPQPCIELHENCRTQTITRGALKLVIREWSPLDDPDLFKQVWHGRLAAGANGGSPSVVNDFKSMLLENRSIPTARILLGEVRLEHDHLRMVDPRWPDELVLGRRVADGYPSCPAGLEGESSEARFVFCKRVPKPEIVYAYAEPKVAEDDANNVIVDPRDEALACKLSALFKIHLAKYPTAGVRVMSKEALSNFSASTSDDAGFAADASGANASMENRSDSAVEPNHGDLSRLSLEAGHDTQDETAGSASSFDVTTVAETGDAKRGEEGCSSISSNKPNFSAADGGAVAAARIGSATACVNGLGGVGEVKDPEAPLFEPHGQEEVDGTTAAAAGSNIASETGQVKGDCKPTTAEVNDSDYHGSRGDDTESFTSAAEGTSPTLGAAQDSSVPGLIGGSNNLVSSEDSEGAARLNLQPEPRSVQQILSLGDLKKIPDPFVPLTTLAKMQASGLIGFRAGSSMDDFSPRRKLHHPTGAPGDLGPAVERLLSRSLGRQRPSTTTPSSVGLSDRSALLDSSAHQTLPITTATCKFFLSGGCARGNGCYFLHPADPHLESKADVRHIVPQHPKFF